MSREGAIWNRQVSREKGSLVLFFERVEEGKRV